MSEELKAALARIACLEGEIAKRDETIARLEPQLNRAIQANYDLREELAACRAAVENCEVFRARIAELEALSVTKVMLDIVPGDGDGYEVYAKSVSDVETKLGVLGEENEELQFALDQLRAELAAIKAQEPIGWYTEDHLDDKSATTYSWTVAERWVEKGWPVSPLYAAPVSEAKAQGVVQWPEADEIMQMAFEEGQPADDASGYCFELEEFDLFIERLMSEVARLNAAPVQQVSVPDASTDFSQFLSAVMDAAGLVRHGRRSKELSEYLGSKCVEYSCFAAPSAPATVQGVNQQLLEALEELMYAHTDKAEALATAAIAAARKGEGK